MYTHTYTLDIARHESAERVWGEAVPRASSFAELADRLRKPPREKCRQRVLQTSSWVALLV